MSDVKRYDPINSDGTCGMCIEDADYGAYVEYADYAALEAELATVKKVAYGNIELLEENQNLKAENAKLRAELERRAVDGWKLAVDNVAGYAHLYNSGSGIIHEIRAEHARLLAAAPSAPKADDPVKQMLLEALNGMLLHIREPESESEFQWPEHFKKQKAAFVAARAAIAAARQEGGKI